MLISLFLSFGMCVFPRLGLAGLDTFERESVYERRTVCPNRSVGTDLVFLFPQALLAAIIVYVNLCRASREPVLTHQKLIAAAMHALSTATGKASDKGAHNTVNGYMAFILFSVAGLACKFAPFPPTLFLKRAFVNVSSKLIDCRHISHPIHGLDNLHAGAPFRWRVIGR